MYVHVCICANTYLDGVWVSPRCQSYICRRAVQVGSLKILKGAAGGERERKRGRAADTLGEEEGEQSSRAAPRRNADCFHVWRGQES